MGYSICIREKKKKLMMQEQHVVQQGKQYISSKGKAVHLTRCTELGGGPKPTAVKIFTSVSLQPLISDICRGTSTLIPLKRAPACHECGDSFWPAKRREPDARLGKPTKAARRVGNIQRRDGKIVVSYATVLTATLQLQKTGWRFQRKNSAVKSLPVSV